MVRQRRRRRRRHSTLNGKALAGFGLFALLYVAAQHPALAWLLAAAVLAAAVVFLAWWWSRRSGRRIAARTLGDLLALSPARFEAEVAVILGRLGYRDVRRVGGAGDLGADLIGCYAQGRRVVVQCKRYAPGNNVGSPDIQTFMGPAFLEHRAERALFVTTAGFSAQARALARRHRIELIDGPTLVQLVRRTATTPPYSGVRRLLAPIGAVVCGLMGVAALVAVLDGTPEPATLASTPPASGLATSPPGRGAAPTASAAGPFPTPTRRATTVPIVPIGAIPPPTIAPVNPARSSATRRLPRPRPTPIPDAVSGDDAGSARGGGGGTDPPDRDGPRPRRRAGGGPDAIRAGPGEHFGAKSAIVSAPGPTDDVSGSYARGRAGASRVG